MTLLTVVRDVCAVVGVTLPQSLFTGITTNRTAQEMLACANENAQRIAYDNREWSIFKKQQTCTGDDSTTAFDLPADYKRMLKTGHVWRSTSTQQPMRFISDTDEWMRRRAAVEVDAWGEWHLMGGQMHIYPAMDTGVTAWFAYIHRNCVALASAGFGDSFQADGDSYRLDERLLKLGMIWDWKAKHGAAYAEDMGTYEDALAVAQGSDKPSPIIISSRNASQMNVRTAYPWPVPT